MFNRICASLAAAFLAASMQVAEARPAPALVSSLAQGAADLPVSGYLNFNLPSSPINGQKTFCSLHPTHCWEAMRSERIHLTPRLLADIRAINAKVNHMIAPVRDVVQFKKADVWTYPVTGKGDCEDYQLFKQRMLRDAGIPQSALRHAYVRSTTDVAHDVLVIRTDRGDFIIDNLSDDVRTPEQTGYKFIMILSQASDYHWKRPPGYDWKSTYARVSNQKDRVVSLSETVLAKLESGINSLASSLKIR